jgi:hypothetical protein
MALIAVEDVIVATVEEFFANRAVERITCHVTWSCSGQVLDKMKLAAQVDDRVSRYLERTKLLRKSHSDPDRFLDTPSDRDAQRKIVWIGLTSLLAEASLRFAMAMDREIDEAPVDILLGARRTYLLRNIGKVDNNMVEKDPVVMQEMVTIGADEAIVAHLAAAVELAERAGLALEVRSESGKTTANSHWLVSAKDLLALKALRC